VIVKTSLMSNNKSFRWYWSQVCY